LALVLFVVGLVPTGMAVWGERRATASAAWRDPADNIRAGAIAPDLAVLSLAGVPDAEVIALSMEMGELETTRALLAFSADLTDAERTSGWVWLAYRYADTGQTERAAQAYRMAGLGAILSADLPDLLRTETLLAVGQQLIPLHDKAGARLFLQQAALIGAHSPRLTPHHRRFLLERLVPASVRTGGGSDDWLSLDEMVQSGQAGGGSIANAQSATGLGWAYNIPERDPVLIQARDARRAAAAAWLTNMSTSETRAEGSPPAESEEETWRELRQALLTEDAAVERYTVRTQAVDGAALATQETQLRWLLLKRRIAAGGAGEGLVPEWESDRDEIDAAVTAAWRNWLALQTGQAGIDLAGGYQVPDARAARWAMTAAYWGLYPNAPVSDLLLAAQSISGSGSLRLSILESGAPPIVGWSE
jgi:hypothetical protein